MSGVLARRRAALLLPPLLAGVAALAIWQAVVVLGRIATFVLPSPTAIATAFGTVAPDVATAAAATGTTAFVGLVAGAVAGVAAAVLAARLRVFDEVLSPLSAAANAMPIIALAPVFNAMFGSTSPVPRRLVVAVAVFFPLFVNTARGLRQVSPVHTELMRSLDATGWAFTRHVRLPGAVPHLFTGLRLASSLSVIAAVVAEYFGGRQDGLGSRITSAASASAYPRAWSYVLGAVALGLVFYLLALLLERLLSPHTRRSL
ncbi:ABC transporter permease subunit [Kineococcus siccus]|uniref:ABC transporter permease subunit n=1 Tax=Kineococcus siccus TaxID=2696567 RepID=UPI00196A5D32